MSAPSVLPSPERLVFLLSPELESGDFPLWEIVWTLNAMAPDVSLGDKLRLARRTASLLVGRYELWRGHWPDGPDEPVTHADSQALAETDEPWYDPEHATLLVWLRQR